MFVKVVLVVGGEQIVGVRVVTWRSLEVVVVVQVRGIGGLDRGVGGGCEKYSDFGCFFIKVYLFLFDFQRAFGK